MVSLAAAGRWSMAGDLAAPLSCLLDQPDMAGAFKRLNGGAGVVLAQALPVRLPLNSLELGGSSSWPTVNSLCGLGGSHFRVKWGGYKFVYDRQVGGVTAGHPRVGWARYFLLIYVRGAPGCHLPYHPPTAALCGGRRATALLFVPTR